MKSIKVKQIDELENKSIEQISLFLDKNLTYHHVDMLNWPKQYPYKPICKFKIAYSKTKLYIKYYVAENNIRAQYLNDMEPVWQDSCVEFFCKLPEQNSYCNFEFNCIGTCLATKRTGRNENIVPFTNEQLKQIERFSNLERNIFDKSGYFEWTLVIAIPLNLIDFDIDKKSNRLNVNFYKCGDKTKIPHFLSWNFILSENPDFHRPEFFGELLF